MTIQYSHCQLSKYPSLLVNKDVSPVIPAMQAQNSCNLCYASTAAIILYLCLSTNSNYFSSHFSLSIPYNHYPYPIAKCAAAPNKHSHLTVANNRNSHFPIAHSSFAISQLLTQSLLTNDPHYATDFRPPTAFYEIKHFQTFCTTAAILDLITAWPP